MPSSRITLVVGLGNPGPSYEHTRHNAGAWFIEQIAAEQSLSLKEENKFHGLNAKASFSQDACQLLLPTTFMNASGQSVSAIANFYKIKPEHILVVHDEIDLPPGTIKLKYSGGHGGHNGLRDIIKALGTNHFYRLRIGVGKAAHKDDVSDFVLKKPSQTEQTLIDGAIYRGLRELNNIVAGEFEAVMKNLHTTDKLSTPLKED